MLRGSPPAHLCLNLWAMLLTHARLTRTTYAKKWNSWFWTRRNLQTHNRVSRSVSLGCQRKKKNSRDLWLTQHLGFFRGDCWLGERAAGGTSGVWRVGWYWRSRWQVGQGDRRDAKGGQLGDTPTASCSWSLPPPEWCISTSVHQELPGQRNSTDNHQQFTEVFLWSV